LIGNAMMLLWCVRAKDRSIDKRVGLGLSVASLHGANQIGLDAVDPVLAVGQCFLTASACYDHHTTHAYLSIDFDRFIHAYVYYTYPLPKKKILHVSYRV
jgi:hypothetical protein